MSEPSQLDLADTRFKWEEGKTEKNRARKWVLFRLLGGELEMRGGGFPFHVDLGFPKGGTVIAAGELYRFDDGEVYVCDWTSSSYRVETPETWRQPLKDFFTQHKVDINTKW